MNLRLLLLTSLASLLLVPELKAQQDREQALKALEAEQQQYFKQKQKEEQDFYSERDRAFAQLLKERWRAQPASQPLKADPMPKRPQQPLVPGTSLVSSTLVDTTWRIPPKLPVKDTTKVKHFPFGEPKEPEPEPAKNTDLITQIPFFGQQLSFLKPFEAALQPSIPLTSARISRWWELMAKDKKSTLQTYSFRRHADQYQLQGWSIFQLVKTYVEQLTLSTTHQRMLAWYYLNHLGYDAKLGIDGNGGAILMVSTDAELYGVTFYQETSSGKRYYFLMKNSSLPGNRFLTYKPASFDKAIRPLEMNAINFLLTEPETSKIQRNFSFNGVKHTYSFSFGRNRMNLLATWPQAAFPVYAQPNSKLEPLVEEIKKQTKSLNKREKADYLLALVQNSLSYQEDNKQFGTERHLFPEETLVMPYSDCEDRSFLYATLMKMAFNFEVILIDYPGHVATAVNLGTPASDDDTLKWKGQTWVICDPTYMNASSGMSMPDFKNITPEIIAL